MKYNINLKYQMQIDRDTEENPGKEYIKLSISGS